MKYYCATMKRSILFKLTQDSNYSNKSTLTSSLVSAYSFGISSLRLLHERIENWFFFRVIENWLNIMQHQSRNNLSIFWSWSEKARTYKQTNQKLLFKVVRSILVKGKVCIVLNHIIWTNLIEKSLEKPNVPFILHTSSVNAIRHQILKKHDSQLCILYSIEKCPRVEIHPGFQLWAEIHQALFFQFFSSVRLFDWKVLVNGIECL